MYEWFKFFHLGAGIVWLGGMTLVVLALRPVLIARLQAPERLAFMSDFLSRFFVMVWLSIALLLASGLWMLSVADMNLAPRGWHAMSGIGLLMCAIFGHIWFVPFKRLKRAIAAADGPTAAKALGQIHHGVLTNLTLGWLAVALVLVWR